MSFVTSYLLLEVSDESLWLINGVVMWRTCSVDRWKRVKACGPNFPLSRTGLVDSFRYRRRCHPPMASKTFPSPSTLSHISRSLGLLSHNPFVSLSRSICNRLPSFSTTEIWRGFGVFLLRIVCSSRSSHQIQKPTRKKSKELVLDDKADLENVSEEEDVDRAWYDKSEVTLFPTEHSNNATFPFSKTTIKQNTKNEERASGKSWWTSRRPIWKTTARRTWEVRSYPFFRRNNQTTRLSLFKKKTIKQKHNQTEKRTGAKDGGGNKDEGDEVHFFWALQEWNNVTFFFILFTQKSNEDRIGTKPGTLWIPP